MCRSGREGEGMSLRKKGVADGISNYLEPRLSTAMESSGRLWVEEEEEDCQEGKMAGRKAPPVQIRDDTGISIACA